MEFRVEVSLRLRKTTMAIPFVVPAEYGPLPAANNNGQQQQAAAQAQQIRARGSVDRNNNHMINLNQINQNYVPDLLNHHEDNNAVEQQNNQAGFLAQLAFELWTVFSGEQPRRPRLESPRNRDNPRHGPRLEQGAPPLPDVVQCHGLIFDLAIESRRVLPTQFHAQHNQPMVPLYNNQVLNYAAPQLIHDLDEEQSWSFKVSLEIGQNLRGIGDQFEFENSERRRVSSQSQTQTRSLKLRVMLRVALPAVAIVGLGLSYIRRHL